MTDPHTAPPGRNDTADWLDGLLYEARPRPLADDGFTARLMEKIPQPAGDSQSGDLPRLPARQGLDFYRSTLIGAVIGAAIACVTTSYAEWEALGNGILGVLGLQSFALGTLAPLLAAVGNAALLAYLFLENERT